MKKLFLAFILLISSLSTFASFLQAPPKFSYQDGQAIFVDFNSAKYEIIYDLNAKVVMAVSLIEFESHDEGYPLFDLVADPEEAFLDGVAVQTQAIKDPDQQTTLRIVQEKISAGHHQLMIKHKITTNVVFNEDGVSSSFWMSDLSDRRYLEQYLPTNLEFDQYQMQSFVKVLNGEGIPHLLKSNGQVSKIDENTFDVIYPSFYTASSMYFHLFPEKSLPANVQFYYPSIDGRLLPVDIYTIYNVDEFVAETKRVLAELEADYGPFPHEQIIIYGNVPSGGMEYSGATATSFKALSHELFHSYHARALMPANGNAGWMDEAIARWRDNNYPLLDKLFYESTKLAGHSIWARMTDRMAYKEGSAFLSWVAYRMGQNNLSFKVFLRDYFHAHKYTTVTTELFKKELIQASGLELEADFSKYIYGLNSTQPSVSLMKQNESDEFHPKYTEQELLNLTLIR